jgi:hypothetical protein
MIRKEEILLKNIDMASVLEEPKGLIMVNQMLSNQWNEYDVQELLWDSIQDNIIRIYQEHRTEGSL